VELHLKESLKSDENMVRTWITKMSAIIIEAFNEISKDKSDIKWSSRDLMIWIDALKYYPKPENQADITNYLLDASRRLFRAK
jgi:hypothetical protein